LLHLQLTKVIFFFLFNFFFTLKQQPTNNRSDFEHKHVTFEDHITKEHNLWNYLYFVIHLRTKDETEFTGPESFIFQMIQEKNLEWFPRLRTASVNPETEESEKEELKLLREQVKEAKSEISTMRRQLSDLIGENNQRMRENARSLIRRTSTAGKS